MKIITDREASKEEIDAILRAEEILAKVGLELIGTRPRDRE